MDDIPIDCELEQEFGINFWNKEKNECINLKFVYGLHNCIIKKQKNSQKFQNLLDVYISQ
jgi:hypothetical protein